MDERETAIGMLTYSERLTLNLKGGCYECKKEGAVCNATMFTEVYEHSLRLAIDALKKEISGGDKP